MSVIQTSCRLMHGPLHRSQDHSRAVPKRFQFEQKRKDKKPTSIIQAVWWWSPHKLRGAPGAVPVRFQSGFGAQSPWSRTRHPDAPWRHRFFLCFLLLSPLLSGCSKVNKSREFTGFLGCSRHLITFFFCLGNKRLSFRLCTKIDCKSNERFLVEIIESTSLTQQLLFFINSSSPDVVDNL